MRSSIVVLCCGLALGCSSRVSPDQRASTQRDFDSAVAAFRGEQFDRAGELLDGALRAGGLTVDDYCTARMMRAVCRAYQGQAAAGLAELDELASQAPDLAAIWRARGDIHRKQGDLTKAKSAYHEARKLNPQIELPMMR